MQSNDVTGQMRLAFNRKRMSASARVKRAPVKKATDVRELLLRITPVRSWTQEKLLELSEQVTLPMLVASQQGGLLPTQSPEETLTLLAALMYDARLVDTVSPDKLPVFQKIRELLATVTTEAGMPAAPRQAVRQAPVRVTRGPVRGKPVVEGPATKAQAAQTQATKAQVPQPRVIEERREPVLDATVPGQLAMGDIMPAAPAGRPVMVRHVRKGQLNRRRTPVTGDNLDWVKTVRKHYDVWHYDFLASASTKMYTLHQQGIVDGSDVDKAEILRFLSRVDVNALMTEAAAFLGLPSRQVLKEAFPALEQLPTSAFLATLWWGGLARNEDVRRSRVFLGVLAGLPSGVRPAGRQGDIGRVRKYARDINAALGRRLQMGMSERLLRGDEFFRVLLGAHERFVRGLPPETGWAEDILAMSMQDILTLYHRTGLLN